MTNIFVVNYNIRLGLLTQVIHECNYIKYKQPYYVPVNTWIKRVHFNNHRCCVQTALLTFNFVVNNSGLILPSFIEH